MKLSWSIGQYLSFCFVGVREATENKDTVKQWVSCMSPTHVMLVHLQRSRKTVQASDYNLTGNDHDSRLNICDEWEDKMIMNGK